MTSSEPDLDETRMDTSGRESERDPIRVLHVTDEPEFGELVETYLEGERDTDIEVVTETDAETGLERLENGRIDCVVSDYEMPEKDGLEFLKEVRERYPDLPFILFTAKGSEEVASEAVSAGVTDYLRKKSGTGQYEVLAESVKDATEKHHAETERRESDRRNKEDHVGTRLKEKAMEEAPVGITISGSSEDDVPMIYANEGFRRITGYPEDEILGQNCRFLQGEETDEEPVRRMRESIEAGENVSVEVLNYRKDGTEFWSEVQISPIADEDGEVSNFVGFQQDISERKRKERHLERQLEQFERFGGVLSHDLSSPLTVVKERIKLAQEEYEDEHLERANEALERVESLVEDLAEVMREGELVNDIEEVSLEETAREVWETVASGNEDVTLEVEDSRIRADEDALARLLENLLRNAVEHGSKEDKPKVKIGALPDAHVKVGTLPDGFYVEDDGPGIPPEKSDDVFGFGHTAKNEEGHGVGLASVRQIAVAHGWEVGVIEGEDGGARFEVRDVEKARG